MLYLAVGLAVVFFAPVIFKIYLFFDEESGRANFCVYVFFVRVFGGYAKLSGKYLMLHLSEKQAKGFTKNDMNMSGVNLLRAFFPLEFYLGLRVPYDNLSALFAFHSACVLTAPVIKTLKPALKVTAKAEGGQSFSLAAKLKTTVNLFSVLLKLSEGLWKKAIKQKK
mgnify:CR=1 FL=1